MQQRSNVESNAASRRRSRSLPRKPIRRLVECIGTTFPTSAMKSTFPPSSARRTPAGKVCDLWFELGHALGHQLREDHASVRRVRRADRQLPGLDPESPNERRAGVLPHRDRAGSACSTRSRRRVQPPPSPSRTAPATKTSVRGRATPAHASGVGGGMDRDPRLLSGAGNRAPGISSVRIFLATEHPPLSLRSTL